MGDCLPPSVIKAARLPEGRDEAEDIAASAFLEPWRRRGLEAREEGVMRKMMSGSQAATVNAKDIDALKKFWADDVKLTFVGQPPIEGKDAVEAWYRSWFAGIKEIRETSTNFALVHPYALGVSNTVLFEAKSDIEFTDGRHVVESEVAVIEIRGGKATSIRVYIADEDGGQVLMGSRASRHGAGMS